MKVRAFFKGQDARVVWGNAEPKRGHEAEATEGALTFHRACLGIFIRERWHIVGVTPFYMKGPLFILEGARYVRFTGPITVYRTWWIFWMFFLNDGEAKL